MTNMENQVIRECSKVVGNVQLIIYLQLFPHKYYFIFLVRIIGLESVIP